MKKIILTLIISCSLLFNLNAQELRNYNLYNQNPALYNPAASTSDNYLNVFLNSHLQWVGFTGSPKVYTLGAFMSFLPNMGAGFTVFNSNQGLIDYTDAKARYSFQINFAKEHFLTFGASFGIVNNRLMVDKAQYVDFSDTKLSEQYFNKTVFSTGFGLLYKYKNIDAQIIMPQIFEYDKPNFYTIGVLGYNYIIDSTWSIKPSVLVRGDGNTPVQYDANVMAIWRKDLWAQFGYRSNNSFIFSLGINILNYAVGYAYQANTQPISYGTSGTHEVQVIFTLPKREKRVKIRYTNVTGVVKDKRTDSMINAKIVIYENDAEKAVIEESKDLYNIELEQEKSYKFEISSEDYEPVSELITTEKKMDILEKNFVLRPLKTNVSGIVTNKYTGAPIESELYILEGNKIIETLDLNSDGTYNISLYNGKEYNFKIKPDNYEKIDRAVYLDSTGNDVTENFELEPIIVLKGTITDIDSKKPLAASIELVDINSNNVIATINSDAETGKYSVQIKDYKSISITALAQDYFFANANVENDLTKYEIIQDLALKSMTIGAKIVLNNVEFDYAKSTLRPESMPELDRLIGIMKTYPKVKVEISGHTDNVGTNEYNKKLSKDRAESVVHYIVSKGISEDRLVYEGYGSDKPRSTNDTKEGRQLNRRVEAEIIK